MKRLIQVLVALSSVAVAMFLIGGAASGSSDRINVAHDAATGKLKPAKIEATITTASGTRTVTKTLPFISDSSIAAAQDALGISAADQRAEGADGASGGNIGLDGSSGSGGTATGSGPAHSLGCGGRTGAPSAGNKRVNQDCTFRRQAEEEITYNPTDPNNLLAGQNDSRVGFNQCGFDWSTNNGKNWGDELPPFRQKVNNPAGQEPSPTDPNRHTIVGGVGTLHTYDADSDPAVAFDALGRGYFSCVAFDVLSNASLLWVSQSPVGAEGSFFFNLGTGLPPGADLTQPASPSGRRFVVAEDNSPEVFHDKEFITADRYASSPNRGNVYVTWTVFRFAAQCEDPVLNPSGYCRSPIFGSMSTDGARHWSTPEEISGTSDALCFFGNLFDVTQNPHACNFDQGSDPTVLPNGDLEVIFNNGNTSAGNPNAQQLGVHCHPTGSSPAGTAHLNCAEPSFVGTDVIRGEPLCDFGRGPEECIPGAFIRTNDFPRLNEDNTQTNHLYATWQDYRNGEFDIQLSQSLDGGLTWHEMGTVNPDRGLDHYFPAIERAPLSDMDRLGDSYFRTERVPGENVTPVGGFAPGVNPGVGEGNSDYVLAGGTDGITPYDFKVVSVVFAPPDGIQAGFNGDYSGLTINKGADTHPIWSDTRNVDPYAPQNSVVHDEDVFTDNVGLPNGTGKPSAGTIGKR